MANIKILGLTQDPYHSATYGNAWIRKFVLRTNKIGAVEGADTKIAVQAGDVVTFGVFPRGMELMDCMSITTSGGLAGTAKIGWRYADGVDDQRIPQSDTYFHEALPLDADDRVRADNKQSKPVRLPKEVELIATMSDAQTGEGVLEVIVEGISHGPL